MTSGLHDPLPHHRLSLIGIIEAAASIDPIFLDTAEDENRQLSRALGCDLVLKDETENPIHSFKGRGADHFVRKVNERGDDRRLVCASTGNFGQAMAYVCRERRREVVVFADLHANPLKLGRIAEFGAEVRQVGRDFDAAKEAARDYCELTGSWMIEDGREPEISEGAGTIAVELFQNHRIDILAIPLGNGALINGVARWTKAASPDTVVRGVSARGADAMARSFLKRRVVERRRVRTIAEGIAVRTPVPEAVEDMLPLIDDVVLVDDRATIAAMRLIRESTGRAIEPAGAIGVAAIMAHPELFEGRQVATILTGANMSPEQMERWLGSRPGS